MRRKVFLFALATAVLGYVAPAPAAGPAIKEFPVPQGSHPHDVAPARDGGVWYTAQHAVLQRFAQHIAYSSC
jgi:virginiamycin B lyase